MFCFLISSKWLCNDLQGYFSAVVFVYFSSTVSYTVIITGSVVDPHRFQCDSGSSFGSGSRVLITENSNFTAEKKNPIIFDHQYSLFITLPP